MVKVYPGAQALSAGTNKFANLLTFLPPTKALHDKSREKGQFAFTQLILSFLKRHSVAVTSQPSGCILNRRCGKQKHTLT